MKIAIPSAPEKALLFGPFRFIRARSLLMRGDTPVRVGSRALKILATLLQNPGEVVSKKTLLSSVWPHTIVAEGALRVHIAGLRKILGDSSRTSRYIESIAGYGYRFVAGTRVAGMNERLMNDDEWEVSGIARPIARDAVITTVINRLLPGCLMTIVGPPGVGKSAVAAAIANDSPLNYPDRCCHIDVAALARPDRLDLAIAAKIGIAAESSSIAQIIARLKELSMLLVFDNCECAAESTARIAEQLIGGTGGIGVLATSREPLRAKDEKLLRLAPLETPPRRTDLTASQALSFPAVRLFSERAAATLHEFEITNVNAPQVAAICRKLDGLPLAIELAAACLDTLSLSDLQHALDDLPNVLTKGRRTSPPRHQTLKNAFDSSFSTLSQQQRAALARLARFDGAFDILAASAALADENISPTVARHLVTDLAARSLLMSNAADARTTFRMLNTCRAAAFHLLGSTRERGSMDDSVYNRAVA